MLVTGPHYGQALPCQCETDMTAIDAISKDEAALRTMVARLNIEHYRKILTEETDETKRQTLLHLVDEENVKLQSLLIPHTPR